MANRWVARGSRRRAGRSLSVRTRGVALLGVLAMLLTACTPPGLPEPITPSGVSSVPTSPPAAGTIVVGLDGSAGRIAGFNPYSIADFSLASQAAASLILPSTFVLAADGTLTPDLDVVDAAVVTSQDPFTVTYTLDRKASWSDGTPITAEDFSYLRDQLLTQPGTVGPAGYQLIRQIRSRDAGKLVEVEFNEPFPDWQTLFSPLLPSHLMKDSPGGWVAALSGDLPLSANRYKMTSYDPVTGQISLARNDKYWATPPQSAAVVLRLGDPADLLAAYSRGDVQALWFSPNAATETNLQDAVPADLRTVVPVPASAQLIFNTTSGLTALQSIRTAIAAGITRSDVAADLTGGRADGGSTVISQVRLPSAQDTAQSPMVTGEQAAADALAGAGFVRNGLYVSRNGEVLRLTLGYPGGDPRLAAAASTIQRQLGGIGIEIDLLPDAARNLVETRIASGAIDLALLDVPRGMADTVAAASAFGCPTDTVLGIGSTVATTATPTGAGQESSTGGAGTVQSEQGSAPTPTAGTTAPQDGSTPSLRTGNLSGYCQSRTQRVLIDAISGGESVDVADELLWADLPVLPLIQPSAVFAVAEPLRSVLDGPHDGWMWSGPLSGLSGWPVS